MSLTAYLFNYNKNPLAVTQPMFTL